MTTSAQRMVPLRPGMFEMPDTIDGTPALYGQRCATCHETFGTTGREFCANCGEPALERVTLSTSGEVFTCTIVRQQLRGALVQVPYVLARVRLPEGVTVQTVLTEVDPAHAYIGMPVEICLKQLTEDEDGNAVVNFFFRPSKSEDRSG